ncbi:MAG: ABC transporter substrate-binding protein [Beggiatoa sp. IS2]|nr:MAG: ABC transporter substrate-binding protein [Beggiatoa sp. IS2]
MFKRYLSFLFNIIPFLYLSNVVYADSSAALGYTPKYKPDFEHFDYVNPQAPKGGTLVLSGPGHFDSLNPFLLKGIYAERISTLLFDSLMERSLDEPSSLYSLLATEIKLAENKQAVTFTLHPKAIFSDGTPVTAEDVKFSFDTLKSEQSHPQYRFYWADIQRAEVIDKQTIRFFFVKENPELHLIIADLPVFSKAAVGDKLFTDLTTTPLMGSGAYLVDTFEIGKYITYKRNPNYWAKDLSCRRGIFNFDQITFKYYKDSDVSLEALKAGEFDFMTVYNSKNWARDFEGPKFERGEIKKSLLTHQNNAGMQAFVFNLRRPIFQDIRVRKAINLAFDFEWANEHLFFNQYKRCNSYFSNSELASNGLPSGEERVLLESLREKFPTQFPKEALEQIWQPVTTQSPHSLRENLRQAKALLIDAGWEVKDGVLHNAEGTELTFEVLLTQAGFERIVAPFAKNLEKLGIKITYRTVDVALYQRRQDTFDFDMMVHIFGQSQSPGNELMSMWHSSSATQEGSNNLLGLQNPVVDALIEKVIYAPNREELVTTVHALDRVMLWGWYVVPNWYNDTHRIAYWNKFGQPATVPLYYLADDWVIKTWWKK